MHNDQCKLIVIVHQAALRDALFYRSLAGEADARIGVMFIFAR